MSGRIVVGYTATKAGRDAVAVAGGLAAASGAELDIVLVLPGEGRGQRDVRVGPAAPP